MNKKKKNRSLVSLFIIIVLSLGNVAFVDSGIWNVSAGTVIDVSTRSPEDYLVDSVSLLKDGAYKVICHTPGFQSDIQLAVILSSTGTHAESIEIISQGETEGIGTNITNDDFLSQFSQMPLPLGIAGTNFTIVSPGTGETWGSAVEAETKPTEVSSDHNTPSLEDHSAEALAMQNLYRAGLLDSARQQKPLEKAVADYSPEELAEYRLAKADLLMSSIEVTVSASAISDLEEVNAVSGATVSSKAVVSAVNNAYFFLKEHVLND